MEVSMSITDILVFQMLYSEALAKNLIQLCRDADVAKLYGAERGTRLAERQRRLRSVAVAVQEG